MPQQFRQGLGQFVTGRSRVQSTLMKVNTDFWGRQTGVRSGIRAIFQGFIQEGLTTSEPGVYNWGWFLYPPLLIASTSVLSIKWVRPKPRTRASVCTYRVHHRQPDTFISKKKVKKTTEILQVLFSDKYLCSRSLFEKKSFFEKLSSFFEKKLFEKTDFRGKFSVQNSTLEKIIKFQSMR